MPKGFPANLTGQRFGDWRVMYRAGVDAQHKVLWNCMCTCGERRLIPTSNLTLGLSTRCRSCSNRKQNHRRWQK